MAEDSPAEPIAAAGAVIYRHAAGDGEVGLIHRLKYGDWTFPKGKVEPGEHVIATAVREVGEETGIAVVLGRKLGRVSYDSNGHPKSVDYWAAQAAPGASTDFVPNNEVDDLIWLPPPAAQDKLSYQHDVALLAEFAAGPADTIPLILLRHASAGSKDTWDGADLDRPLDSQGKASAQQLAGLLPSFGRCRVFSSAARRCIATVEPYARQTGQGITIEPALTVLRDTADADGLAELAARITAEAQPTVLCGHRENLLPVLASICASLGGAQPSLTALSKGGFWVLQIADGILASAEKHGLPG